MKKKQKQLLISLALLAGLVIFAVMQLFQKGNGDSTITEKSGDFSIKDTANIGKFIITDQDKNKAELVRKTNSYWELNGKYRARPESIDLILYTAYNIAVKNPVPKAAQENIIRNLAVMYKKVEYYDNNGNWIKTWYVGHPTKDNEGSYMLLEDENGKAKIPSVTYIPGFMGQLTSRYFYEEKSWRYTGVFNYDPREIAAIKVVNNDSVIEGFEIKALENDRFLLNNAFGKPVDIFDTAAVRQYLVNFKKIHFQSFNMGILTSAEEDSLRTAKPFYVITVTDKSGKKNEIAIYHKKLPPFDDMGQDWDFAYPWDPQRAFAILSTGEVVVIQFGVFDHVLWPVYAFTHSKRLKEQGLVQ